ATGRSRTFAATGASSRSVTRMARCAAAGSSCWSSSGSATRRSAWSPATPSSAAGTRWWTPSCAARGSCTVAEPTIRIAIAYAERARQTLIELDVPPGTTAAEAVERSQIRALHSGIPADAALGVHGRVVAPATVLAAGDRVELYRPLPADPKDRRRRLARE